MQANPTGAWAKVRSAIESITAHQLRSFDGKRAVCIYKDDGYSGHTVKLSPFGVRVFELARAGWWRAT